MPTRTPRSSTSSRRCATTPTHGSAIAALEKLARERRDNALLADMLRRRLEAQPRWPSDAAASTLLVEIAELERKAGHADAALATLARAASAAPNDVRVLGPLADMYFAIGPARRGRADLRPARDRGEVRAPDEGRREVPPAPGQHPRGPRTTAARATAAYEEALRVNPTDVVTMMGLGRLYFAGKDWEKARKIYQSLVLQNIDCRRRA